MIEDLVAARMQMALSLGWHIVVACLGVGFPALVLLAEWRGIRTGDRGWTLLARRWAKALAVVFAVGAVSGTILSFEMGLLWPGLMGTYGEVIGLPFAIEGIAFFIEAIFLGIYLFAWGRLPPRAHLLSGIPIVLAGLASAFFVVTANAWMQQPEGFRLVDGRVVDVSPWEAMFNRATPHQTVHMLLAALMVTGFLVASVYAVAILRGKGDAYHRRAFALAFSLGAVAAPAQVAVGDWAAHSVAEHQPVKLAAMEALFRTEQGAALRLGGIVVDDELRYAVEIPNALSLLAYWDPDATVAGLEEVPPDLRPPVGIVHWAFDIMVAVGLALLALSAWFAVVAWRRRRLPDSSWFYRAAVVAGPAAVVALEAGWVVTEVGRQPWIVYGQMLTADAVNPMSGLRYGFYALLPVYVLLTVALIYVLRRLARAPFDDGAARRVSDYRVVPDGEDPR
ncbi:cytochrome ubiquinol oxidase subunit I [Myceligenerans salitolerans]|uniref:Cytochrome ubiquinol oxidase subunit I n=1 Tax=Myceligenerans salitolerans TaxID=1230528 RepID=A0ABS3IBC7_9MICO|nr:cytochrome ubiquinol oxidase subunit I [Myceligenerans salitolerans]MBO0610330.1 cytochrome ubiquinol oxidase subunit I [Myceligenerans salitolerans]